MNSKAPRWPLPLSTRSLATAGRYTTLWGTTNLDGFCLVTSDSDFTRLAARIREEGLTVYGFGESKTPEAFRAACDTFINLDNLKEVEAPATPHATSAPRPTLKRTKVLDGLLSKAIASASGDDGWASLSTVGSNLSRLASDFDSRNWGFTKLKDLVAAHPHYEVELRSAGEGKSQHAFVRHK